jgi:hypothetical protein
VATKVDFGQTARDYAQYRAGFQDIETFSFDVPAIYSHAAWRGRIRASAGVAASLAPDQVAWFDAELARLLTQRFPTDPLEIPHRVFAVVCRAPCSEDVTSDKGK